MPLLADALFALVTAGVFAFVGREFSRRPASREARRARDSFVGWWYGISFLTFVGAARSALAAFGVVDLPIHLALSFLSLLPLTIALFGLLYYLLYIHTGNSKLFGPLAAAYVALFVGFAWLTTWLRPTAVTVGEWQVGLAYERTLEGWPTYVLLVVLLGPVLLAAGLYGSLALRAPTRAARYRIGMTAGAFLLWFGSSGTASVAGAATAPGWPLVARVIGLVATAMVLAAYKPPPAVRRWLEAEDGAPAEPQPRRPDGLSPYARNSMRSTTRGEYVSGAPAAPA